MQVRVVYGYTFHDQLTLNQLVRGSSPLRITCENARGMSYLKLIPPFFASSTRRFVRPALRKDVTMEISLGFVGFVIAFLLMALFLFGASVPVM